ncbi:hypothetical protein EX30DRAFT_337951 [Ascodesmis nigricans]|uniref:Glucanase n=1 Tax=Ascodesmis nigricans TaxID=341454 RepID=A0A4S2N8D9_9PEZI|nr:hypothetical protein EX30DRAFT_337951 [Ascodesmis nigricans]
MKSIFLLGLIAAVAAQSDEAGLYQQCGGINHSGPTKCVSGSTCTVINDYYHQCLPGSNSNPGTTLSTTTTATAQPPTTTTTTTPAPTPTAPAAGNPFAGKTQWANPYYASEISSLAIPSLIAAGKPALATKAAEVAKVPSFTWLDKISKVPSVREYLQLITDSGKASTHIAPFVVYNLPDRDCAALASNGELALAAGGAQRYKTEYIDEIRAALLEFPDISIVLVIEPDSLANMVTNMGVAKCAGAAEAYKELTVYAVKRLALPNVTMYLDGGHGGWLGWPANLPEAAKIFAQIYKDAGAPSQLRGLVTNVSNYNGWDLATCPAITSPNPNCDEKRFINALAPALASNGWPNAHFIIDQGRSGKQPTGQLQQGDWCNAKGTGFGARPGTATGDALADAIVWVKPGGESDGTSDTTAERYDAHCGSESSVKPAPEAGSWFQAYFEQLLVNANPAF